MRSSSLLYIKKEKNTEARIPVDVSGISKKVEDLKELRRSRFFNGVGRSSQASASSHFLLQSRNVKHGLFTTTH